MKYVVFHRRWYVLLILLTPVAGDTVRKFLPGQPNWVVPAFSTIVLMAVTIWLISRPKRIIPPAIFGNPLAIWFFFASIYTIPSIYIDWRIAPATFFFRLMPMFLSIFVYRTIKSPDDFVKVVRILSFLPIILLPFGMISLLIGNHVLPFFLRPTEQIEAMGRDFRAGFDMCSTIFATAPVMANTISSLFFLTLSCSVLPKQYLLKHDKVFFMSSLIADIILSYATTRRGDFLLILAGFSYFLFLSKRFSSQGFTITLIGIVVLSFMDRNSTAKKEYTVEKRSKFMFSSSDEISNRFNNIFMGSIVHWICKKPFGKYYGWAGRESAMFAPADERVTESVETGGAQLVADTGFFGALLMPVMLIVAWVNLRLRSRQSQCENAIKVLIFGAAGLFILYYFKVISVLSSLYQAQLFFWMIPGFALSLSKKDTYNKYNIISIK